MQDSIATQSVKKIIRSIENNSRPIKNLKKTITNFLSNLIDSWLLVDRSIQNKFRLIKIFEEIFQKVFVSLNRSKMIVDRSKLMKPNFPEFSPNSLQQFFMNKLPSYEHNRLSLRSKTEFHWCYNLKVQFNTHLTSNWDIIITSFFILVNNSFNINAENWLKNLLTLWNYLLWFQNSQNMLYKFKIEDHSDTNYRKNIVYIAYKTYTSEK